jgi:hypothetical protein
MKLSWVPGVLLVAACNGEVDVEVSDQEGTAVTASALETLRNCGGGNGHGGDDGHGNGHGNDGGVAGLRNALRRGASRIADLQADTIGDNAHNGLTDADPDDGGWDFTLPAAATAHTANPSASNCFGATALGPWAAIRAGASGVRSVQTLLDAGVGMQNDPDVDSAPDFVFGVLLAELADNRGFAEIARQHYDAKRAAAGGALGLGHLIRDSRHAANNDGLIPYDLGWMMLGAAALADAFPSAGYRADADTYARIVVEDLTSASPRFDINNAHERFYVTGLSWSLVAASWLGADATLREARTLLLDEQRGDGAWGWNADQPAADLQSTAHALQTLSLSGSIRGRSSTAARRGARWLLGQQASSGGWPDATHNELPLVDAEIMLGLVLSQTEVGRDDGLDPHVALQPGSAAPAGNGRNAAPLD